MFYILYVIIYKTYKIYKVAAIILIVLYAINLGIEAAKRGEVETKEYNFWLTLLGTVIIFVLMYFAGTFNSLF